MVASNFSSAPFLVYLTVFKSRLGTLNLVANQTSWAFTPAVTLERALRAVVSEREKVDLFSRSSQDLREYLKLKKLIGATKPIKGRYSDWHWGTNGSSLVFRGVESPDLTAYKIDLWFADPRMRSTIGVPTAENVNEMIELSHQLRIISRTKNSLTSAGHLMIAMRGQLPNLDDNPFVLGPEAIIMLRQIMTEDSLVMVEILDAAIALGPQITRDSIAMRLPELVAAAQKKAKLLRFSPPVLAEGKKFVDVLRETARKSVQRQKRASRTENGTLESRGPGVLEHRTAPRLEWLTDIGAFTKDGIPSNSFQYSVTEDATLLRDILHSVSNAELGADEAALRYWMTSNLFRPMRAQVLTSRDPLSAFCRAYSTLQRAVGPVPLGDVAFLTAFFLSAGDHTVASARKFITDLGSSEKGITFSGGRYTRGADLIHVDQAYLKSIAC